MSNKSIEYKIKFYTNKVQKMLLSKNKAYGSSALEPLNIFSKGRPSDSLCARIDDKLARIKNVGVSDKTEDTLFDLCGYLVLLMISIEDDEKRDI
jgi:hypothetical protein|tara:strand:+ start:618 stop:902 length:285 start_codon:yes stop_codon:yes gene_type:complete